MIDHIDLPQNLIVIEKAPGTIYIGPAESVAQNGMIANDDGAEDVNEAALK